MARCDIPVMRPAQIRARVPHGSEAVHSLAVADRLAAVWVASQEDELAGRQGMVPGAVLPAAWVSGLRSCRLNIGKGLPANIGQRHDAATVSAGGTAARVRPLWLLSRPGSQ